MRAAQDRLPYYSRFEALTEGEPAWAVDRRAVLYHFDGLSFWRRPPGARTSRRVTSWQTPRHGWFHSVDCPCPLCTAQAHHRRAVA